MPERPVPLVRLGIRLSIDILCDNIARIVEARFGEHIRLRPSSVFMKLEATMVARNWCPSRITPTLTHPSASLNYVASLLLSYESESHRGCRRRKCLKLPSTAKGISPLHRDTCAGHCVDISIEESKTIRMWKDGGIPEFRPKAGVELCQLETVDCTGRPFVAISHVWAHGMGNSSENALPTCQVEFLWNSVKQLAGEDAVLWVVPLSVPIDPEGKRIAILKLGKVYAEAHKVLVIDKDLVRVGSDRTEQILQLLCCEWQRRLWTLQEGRLARDLHIQFRDGAVPISTLMDTTMRARSGESGATEIDYTLGVKLDLQHRFFKLGKDHGFFQNLVEDLASRSVTEASDEPLCIAIMLGLDLNEFQGKPKMEDIYRSSPTIPQDLMFLNQPRLATPGLTWAPSTFLECEFVTFLPPDLTFPGRLSVQGLHIVKDCLILHHELVFRSVYGRGVWLLDATNGDIYAIEPQDFVSSDGSSSLIQENRTILKPAVVWEKTGHLFSNVSKAVLVSNLHEKGGTTYAKFEMRLNGWHAGERYKDLHNFHVSQSGGVVANIPADFVKGKRLCVG